MGYLRLVLFFLRLIQPTFTAKSYVKGFTCFTLGSGNFGGEGWKSYTNRDIGVNVVFLIHNKEDLGENNTPLISSLLEDIVDYVRQTAPLENADDHFSLGLGTFSRNISVAFHLGSGITNFYNPALKHAEDFMGTFRSLTYEDNGTNISGALLMAKHFFNVHIGNRIFANNLCILLTTAPPDNPSLAIASAKELQNEGVSILVIAIGDDVNEKDVKDLASNRNVVFTVRINNSATNEVGPNMENVTSSIISSLQRASVLPRYSMCYQAYMDLAIIVDISTNYVQMISHVAQFVAQFNLYYVSIKTIIIHSEVTDETFLKSYNEMVSKNPGILFEVQSASHNMDTSIDRIRQYFLDEKPKRYLAQNILIVVSDKSDVGADDVIIESRACRESGIHVMVLGVGEDVSQDQLNKIITDPMGSVMVTGTEDIFWGLQSLNRKLCPAVCDRGWIYHDNMCYHHRYTIMKTWMDAKEECKAFNGRLVSITSRETLTWLTSTFTHLERYFYIGLRKHAKGSAPTTSDLRWENGKPLVLSNWSTDGEFPQPDGGMYETCVAWYPDGWRDIGCAISTVYGGWLCEREAGNNTRSHVKGVTIRPFLEEHECQLPKNQNFDQEILASGENCRPVLDVYSSKAYPLHAYNCSNGELISKYLLCDGVNHCKDGSDEVGCGSECKETQFQCDNSRCVSVAFVCDFWDDCGDNSDEAHCVHQQCPREKRQCASGQCVRFNSICDLYYDCYDKSDEESCDDTCGQTRCYDGTCIPDTWKHDGQVDCSGASKEDEHLLLMNDPCYGGSHREIYYLFASEKYRGVRPACTMVFDGFGKHFDSYTSAECNGTTLCPSGFYKCPASYCIPLYRVCDGTMDCVDGEDEIGCADYVCPGYFRCPGAGYCLHPSRLCDGEVDCPGGKDEVMCDFNCPENCSCFGGLVKFENPLYGDIISINAETRKLISTKTMVFNEQLLAGLRYITEVILTDASMETLVNVFRDQVNLQKLNISSNRIREIPDKALSQLRNLKILDLSYNDVHYISERSFSGLSKLKELYMRYLSLRVLTVNSLSPLVNLELLDLTGNGIHSVQVGAFTGLSDLRVLYMKQNDIKDFEQGIYDGLKRVEEIYTDVFTLCCPQVRPASVKESQCVSPKNSISSCDDLMANDFLRASLWVLCIASLIGNVLSTGMRILWEKSSMKIGFGVFVTHLGVSDFLMGVYLLVIAVADAKYKGVYIWEDHKWRISPFCKIAGFLATLSSEASAMFIFLITLDRFLVMKFPFGQVRFRFRSATVVSFVAWIIAFVIAGIPLLPCLGHWEFYSKNGACLALPFFTEHESGWIYSVVVFIGFNFVAFILIALGQYSIYRMMKQGSMIATKERMAQDAAVARRLLLIVSTDFLCWFPIGIMGLLALSGTTIGGEVYAWTAVFVLPVNSALNPFLYTIPTLMHKLKTGARNSYEGRKNVSHKTSHESVKMDDLNTSIVLLEDFLQQLNSNKDKGRLFQMVFRCFDENAVVIKQDQKSPNAVYLCMHDKDVHSICISTKSDHRGCEATTLILSLLSTEPSLSGNDHSDVQ